MSDDQVDEDIEICEIVITAPDAEWLATFCRGLIEDRLAAAAHIIEDIRTLYRWDGEIHDTREARAHIRTQTALSLNILERTRAEHPYQVPSVLGLQVMLVNPDYGTWLTDETRT